MICSKRNQCHCQVGVFAAYASRQGYALVDKRLFLPEPWLTDAYKPMVLVYKNQTTQLVFYRLNSAIERGTKPDALGWKPCHWTRMLKAAMVKASRA